jgi:Rps23 Pro-64 3,4-dihydroxylase Tpa1-like proline 4-hydroxylase
MIFRYDWMQENVNRWAKKYAWAPAYPYIMLDGLADDNLLSAALSDFPPASDPVWHSNSVSTETLYLKQAQQDIRQIPPSLREVLYEMNGGAFVEFLEKLTGIDHLLPDPHLYGAGIQQTLPGGVLSIHVDHNINPKIQLYRRLSLALYLNKDWKDKYGGQFEVWKNHACVDRILPVFNRMVIFSNSESSWHGHPQPVACPAGMSRKSLAVWYFSATPDPSYGDVPHMGRFLNHPNPWRIFKSILIDKIAKRAYG